MQKINMTIGRFQPFTIGHLNMVNEGEAPCIVYQIKPAGIPDNLDKVKIGGKLLRKPAIKNVYDYINNGCTGDLTDQEKELLKRPFTNELISKELDIVKKNNKNIIDVVYVVNMFDALCRFNKFCTDNSDKYEPQYLMCGDDRVGQYSDIIDKYDDLETVFKNNDVIPSIIKGKLKCNTGKGRTEGVSGTDVRKAILTKNKSAFSKLMPKGTDSMFDEFVSAFDVLINKLEKNINENKYMSLENYITEGMLLLEGGQAGHMAHPIDFQDMTGNEFIELIKDLFTGKVEDMKEKLDGMNIFATMNNDGETVFIRNNSNLQSEQGGMTVEEMAEKWATKEHQKKVFTQSGNIIKEIFNKLGKEYFNPDSETRKVINCECIVTGKTNIMPYITDRVAFHGYKIYKRDNGKWIESEDVEGHVDDIYKKAEGIQSALPRPKLVIKDLQQSNNLSQEFVNQFIKLYKEESLDLTATIDDYKFVRFKKVKPEWLQDDDNLKRIFNRYAYNDKSLKATEIKKLYPEHYTELKDDKWGKQFITQCVQPMDNLFLSIGNELIELLDGFTNNNTPENQKQVIDNIKSDIETTCDLVKKNGDEDCQAKLAFQMQRLSDLNDKINTAEGIVFTYNGKRMKLTGSFAPVNAILGLRFKFE